MVAQAGVIKSSSVSAGCGLRAGLVERLASRPAFGPQPNAALSLEKLSRVDEFLNAQVAQSESGRLVLIQRHGKPVYFKWFGKRDVDAGIESRRTRSFRCTRSPRPSPALPR